MGMGNPLTLLDYAGNMNCSCDADTAKRGWIEYYAEQSDILQVLPWETINGCTKTIDYEGCVPQANIWRLFNEINAAEVGCDYSWTEHLKVAEQILTIDHAMIRCDGKQKWLNKAKKVVKGWAMTWTNDFLHAPACDLRSPIGLEHRLGRDAVSIYDSNSIFERHYANNFDASTGTFVPGGLPLSLTVAQNVVNQTDLSLGQPYWIMNRQMLSHIQMARGDCSFCFERTENYVERGFPKPETFLGIPILTGYGLTANDPILPFDEEPMGGNNPATMTPNTSSIYLVVFGMEGVHGIQDGPMEYLTTGRQFDDCHLFEKQSWFHMNSWVIEHHAAAARISGITNAPITM